MRQTGLVESFDPASGRGVIVGAAGDGFAFTTFELRASDRDQIAAGRAVSFTQISVDGVTSLEDIAVDPGKIPDKDAAPAQDMAEQLAIRDREIAYLRREIALRQQIQDLLAAAPKAPGQPTPDDPDHPQTGDPSPAARRRGGQYWRHVVAGILLGCVGGISLFYFALSGLDQDKTATSPCARLEPQLLDEEVAAIDGHSSRIIGIANVMQVNPDAGGIACTATVALADGSTANIRIDAFEGLAGETDLQILRQ